MTENSSAVYIVGTRYVDYVAVVGEHDENGKQDVRFYDDVERAERGEKKKNITSIMCHRKRKKSEFALYYVYARMICRWYVRVPIMMYPFR